MPAGFTSSSNVMAGWATEDDSLPGGISTSELARGSDSWASRSTAEAMRSPWVVKRRWTIQHPRDAYRESFPIAPGPNYRLNQELVSALEQSVEMSLNDNVSEYMQRVEPDAKKKLILGDPDHSLFATSKGGEIKLTRLGNNFLRTMEANLNNPYNQQRSYFNDKDKYNKDNIKSPLKIAEVYEHWRDVEVKAYLSRLNKLIKNNDILLDDLGNAKELFIKNERGRVNLSVKGKYAIEDYFDENVSMGSIDRGDLAGFVDAYNNKYSKDKKHIERWNERLNDYLQAVTDFNYCNRHVEGVFEIRIFRRLGMEFRDEVNHSESLSEKEVGRLHKVKSRVLRKAAELFYAAMTPGRWSPVGLKLNSAGKRALARYCKEVVTLSAPQYRVEEYGINPFDFVKKYNAGKYRDPTPATA